ncbi:hypothetical protein [Pseudophaeobacter sp. EL27]|uniref:hypothetical protein n=1 Tax=Pseudophaeobacter sp. EL27 TaxID=2107580 RepID=UPI0013C48074|nr:hypothetical protein [Pseudophaeobacter sp. EL27]
MLDSQRESSQPIFATKPSSDFLGMDPSYYNRIYTLFEMDQFASDMSERTGQEVKVGRSQTHGPKFKVEDLTTKQQQKIREFYKSDYEAFGAYFYPAIQLWCANFLSGHRLGIQQGSWRR